MQQETKSCPICGELIDAHAQTCPICGEQTGFQQAPPPIQQAPPPIQQAPPPIQQTPPPVYREPVGQPQPALQSQPTPPVTPEEPKKKSVLPKIIGALIALAVVGAGVFFGLKFMNSDNGKEKTELIDDEEDSADPGLSKLNKLAEQLPLSATVVAKLPDTDPPKLVFTMNNALYAFDSEADNERKINLDKGLSGYIVDYDRQGVIEASLTDSKKYVMVVADATSDSGDPVQLLMRVNSLTEKAELIALGKSVAKNDDNYVVDNGESTTRYSAEGDALDAPSQPTEPEETVGEGQPVPDDQMEPQPLEPDEEEAVQTTTPKPAPKPKPAPTPKPTPKPQKPRQHSNPDVAPATGGTGFHLTPVY